jgi:hypothetical protein
MRSKGQTKYNGQKKKDKQCIQDITQKTKDWATEHPSPIKNSWIEIENNRSFLIYRYNHLQTPWNMYFSNELLKP